jgi:hypothetical protein
MYAETRSKLTPVDHQYIAETLGKSPEERYAIMRLADDVPSMTDLLHDRRLFERSMTTPPVFLTISPQLFFYVFVYQALDKKQLADDDLVDYVAGVCTEFRNPHALFHFADQEGGSKIYLVDLLQYLADVDRHQQYYLRRHIGNVTLFLTGFFPDYIFQRSKAKGAPPMTYYENIGRAQYETAANDSAEYDAAAGPVLNTLAERFVDIRSAINISADARLHLHNPKSALDRIERQAETLDDQSFLESTEM